MKLLVVTPTLSESRWLAEAVASVASLPVESDHLLVTPEATVGSLSERFCGVSVIAEAGGGMYAAINAGLAAVKDWDAFTYINDDDLLLPGFENAIEAVARAGNTPVMTYGRVRLIDEEGRRIGAIPVSPRPALNRALYAQRIEPVYQHGTVVSRAAWEQFGGFDPDFRFCGDSEFLARLCVRGVPAVRVAGEVAAFRLRRGQLTKNRPAMIEERARVDAKLGLLATRRTARHLWARFIFRMANLPVYAGRIARHGFVSFDTLIERKS